MPFFEQLILLIRPFHTENDFKTAYGLSVQAVLDLWRQKRILVMTDVPNRYVGLDYLDPILEKDPPCLHLAQSMFFRGISNLMGGEQYFDSCFEVALTKIRSSKALDEKMPEQMPVLPYRTYRKDEFISGFATAYASLCGFGYEELATELLSRCSSESLEALLEYNGLLLYYPRCRALDGIVTLQPSDFKLASQLSLKANVQPFPVEVAKLLTRKLQLLLVKDIGWDQIVELRGKTSELRQLLFEIDRCASNGEFEKLPKQEALERVFEEARITSLDIARDRKLSTIAVNAFVGVLGGAVGQVLQGYPGLLSMATATVLAATPFSEKTAEVLSKWKKKSHGVAYFEVQRSLEHV
jgi:hypothetical protein